MGRLKEFVVDAGGWGIVSLSAATVFFAIGIWEHLHNRSVPGFVLVCISVVLFWAGAFVAWLKKQHEVEKLRDGAPEVLVNCTFIRGITVSDNVPLVVDNRGPGTARNLWIEIADDMFKVKFLAIPYLAENSKLMVGPHVVTDMNDFAVDISGKFMNYLRLTKAQDQMGPSEQLIFRLLKVSYENEHGIRFEQDFRISYNIVSEMVSTFPTGRRRIVRSEEN